MKIHFKNRNLSTFSTLIYFIIITTWFFLKVFQFQFNNEVYSDGLTTLQLSKSWLDGRPILFDSYYSDHKLQHNYYFILLIGIFTKPFGVYGLFIAYFTLLTLFLFICKKYFNSFANKMKEYNWTTIFYFALGPIAYYIFMDILGWHPEQYFLPLIGIFALSLANKKYILIVVLIFLIFLLKETSIVILFSCFLFCSVLDSSIKNRLKNDWFHLLNKNNIILSFSCLVLFLLGLLWISYLNGSNNSKLYNVILNLKKIPNRITIVKYVSLSIIYSTLIFIIGLLPTIPFLLESKNKIVLITTISIGYFILFCIFMVEGLYYLNTNYLSSIVYGVTYPSRLVCSWSYLLFCYLYISLKLKSEKIYTKNITYKYLVIGIILQTLLSPFIIGHDSKTFFGVGKVNKNIIKAMNSNLGLNPYNDKTGKQLSNLSEKLPPNAEIIAEKKQLVYFQNVYPYDWNSGMWINLIGKPYIYIYEKEKIGKVTNYFFPNNGYIILENPKLLILADSLWYNQSFKFDLKN